MGSNQLMQVCIVVHDLEEATQRYCDLFGMQMPEIRAGEMDALFNGKPTKLTRRVCGFQMGSVQLELLEPGPEPSTWREFLDTKGEGVHHIGFAVPDLTESLDALAERGVGIRQKHNSTTSPFPATASWRALTCSGSRSTSSRRSNGVYHEPYGDSISVRLVSARQKRSPLAIFFDIMTQGDKRC
jgi:catechol 2,3-dioxygenase-like lactoylglutathione lyase family enzyme